MLELATTPVTDLPQDSVQSSIDVLFAENRGMYPQPLTLHYLFTPSGAPYLRLDSFYHIVFNDFGVPENIGCLLSYLAKFHHQAKPLNKVLFMPLEEVETFAMRCAELLDHLTDSRARFESVVLNLASARCKELSTDTVKLFELVLHDHLQKCKA